jgi:hypothetical protein
MQRNAVSAPDLVSKKSVSIGYNDDKKTTASEAPQTKDIIKDSLLSSV